ncbi:aldehyde dehydrogenase family protein [Nocardia vinacea]|uniref:aldehyde dehydrogenase (NAD(+)) n=1 Tax=Nocardia vinacea TaxID=96468 RepID=A0ABZ1YWJ4_9NOCA|nr:aldehyde dehydrogenase family protein [Nocardia vinacea]
MTTALEGQLFIGGAEVPPGVLDRVEHINPANGRVQGSVPVAGAKEIDRAVSAARAALGSWREMAAGQRRELLIAVATEIENDVVELARLAVAENGTPRRFADQLGCASATGWFRYYAGWPDKLSGEVLAKLNPGTSRLDYTVPEPHGVVAILTAFNAPMSFLGMKVAAALAAGNTVVIKPSELAPFTTDRFARLCARAGVPAGVVNVVHGDGSTGAALVGHPGIDKISFTGSADTASRILVAAAVNLTPAALELGGKSAAVIFDDARIEDAVQICIQRGIATQAGQACLAPTRMLVQRGAYDKAVGLAAAVTEELVVGDPSDERTQVGPVISGFHRDRILGVIAEADGRDGRLVSGGVGLGGALADGFYVEPTVLADVAPGSSIAQQEIFGPVLSMIPFDDEDEAVSIANGTGYELAAYAFTASIPRAHRMVRRLAAGNVSINTVAFPSPHRPFGGNGRSGMGREGGREGLQEMLRTKYVEIDLADD